MLMRGAHAFESSVWAVAVGRGRETLQWECLWAGWDSATAEADGTKPPEPDGRSDHSRKSGDLLERDLWLRLIDQIDQDASRNEVNKQMTRVIRLQDEEEAGEEKRAGIKKRKG